MIFLLPERKFLKYEFSCYHLQWERDAGIHTNFFKIIEIKITLTTQSEVENENHAFFQNPTFNGKEPRKWNNATIDETLEDVGVGGRRYCIYLIHPYLQSPTLAEELVIFSIWILVVVVILPTPLTSFDDVLGLEFFFLIRNTYKQRRMKYKKGKILFSNLFVSSSYNIILLSLSNVDLIILRIYLYAIFCLAIFSRSIIWCRRQSNFLCSCYLCWHSESYIFRLMTLLSKSILPTNFSRQNTSSTKHFVER